MNDFFFQGSAVTVPPHRPSTISDVGSVGKISQSGVIANNLSTHVPPPPPHPQPESGPRY